MYAAKNVVITAGASGIGLAIRQAFEHAGAQVYSVDLLPHDGFVADVGKKEELDSFITYLEGRCPHIDVVVNNAPPPSKGISNCTWDEFHYALSVGAGAPFYLTQRLRARLSDGASIINITSTRAQMSQRETESYSAAKGALSALTHAMAISLGPKVRVNAIAPGWIDTHQGAHGQEDHQQHPAGRIGRVEDVAQLVLYLCSDHARFITAETITIDGGMSRQMIYHNDQGWCFTTPQ